jgi:hypothetical protein
VSLFPRFLGRRPQPDGMLECTVTTRVFLELAKLTPDAQSRVMTHVGGMLTERAAYHYDDGDSHPHDVVAMQ